MADRLGPGDVACWVIKSRTAPQDIAADWVPGAAWTLTRCLRRSYRLDLMRVGQPVLLWVSGRSDPGVRAIGTVCGSPSLADGADPTARELAVTVRLWQLEQPVRRQDLMADHVFAGAEVLRMPAGSNPSFLSLDRWAALRDHLSARDLQSSGWPG